MSSITKAFLLRFIFVSSLKRFAVKGLGEVLNRINQPGQ